MGRRSCRSDRQQHSGSGHLQSRPENRQKAGHRRSLGHSAQLRLGVFSDLGHRQYRGLWCGIVLQFTVALGYPLRVAAGVSRVDPNDRPLHSLAGSGAGLPANVYVPRTNIYEFSAFDWDVIWNWFVGPLVGATIASELGRDPTKSRRFSVDFVPGPGALSAVARLRF